MAEEEKGFVIKDKRTFSQETGEPKEEQTQEAPEERAAESAEKEAPQTEAKAAEGEETQLPEINFSTFIISLNASALVQLGVIEDPASGTKVKNLPVAKQTIDILNMLEEKTRGNLTKEEENIIKNVLYDLRILYVKETG